MLSVGAGLGLLVLAIYAVFFPRADGSGLFVGCILLCSLCFRLLRLFVVQSQACI